MDSIRKLPFRQWQMVSHLDPWEGGQRCKPTPISNGTIYTKDTVNSLYLGDSEKFYRNGEGVYPKGHEDRYFGWSSIDQCDEERASELAK